MKWRISILVLIFCAFRAGGIFAQDITAIDPNDGAALCALAKAVAANSGSTRLSKGSRERVSHASQSFDATYYHLSLDLDRDRTPILKGVVTVTGTATGALSVLSLDMWDGLQVNGVSSSGGQPLNFTRANNTISTSLASTAAPGESVSIVIDYEGEPQSTGFGSFMDGEVPSGPFIWTLSEPYGARDWWPNVDHPSDKADSVRMTIRVPDGLRAGSNGLLVGETENGDGTVTYEWAHHYPIASYLVSFAVGNYDVFEQTYVRPPDLVSEFGPLSLPILHYAFAGTSAFQGTGAQNGWDYITEILPVFERWFGPYPFSAEKYGHAHTTFGGGMEHQTMTSLGGSGWGLIAHELTHMWFGDMITNRTWPHLWLQEGFATMGEILFWESEAGSPNSANYVFNLYFDRALTAQGTLVVQDTMQVGNLFASSRVYSKGAMVLHMIRRMVGDDVFREILRKYAADPAVKYGNAETADFERVASAVSGLDLSTFFRQWVTEGTGYPEYAARWAPEATATGPAIRLEISQTQDASISNESVFDMPVRVVVYSNAGDGSEGRYFTVQNNRRVQTYLIPLDFEPGVVAIDPFLEILRRRDIWISRLPPPSNFDWSVYPNPARDAFFVRFELPIPADVTARLIDAAGRTVREYDFGTFGEGTYVRRPDLPPGLASGVYVVDLEAAEKHVSKTITIVR